MWPVTEYNAPPNSVCNEPSRLVITAAKLGLSLRLGMERNFTGDPMIAIWSATPWAKKSSS